MESMSAKRLNSTALPSITGLAASGAEIAQAQNGGAIGDDGDEIAFDGVVVGAARILGDGQHRDRNAGRISERQVALGGHRLGGDHFQLAGPADAMELQGFLVGKGRPIGAAGGFCEHFYSILRNTDATGTARPG